MRKYILIGCLVFLGGITMSACSTVCAIPGISALPGCPTATPTAAPVAANSNGNGTDLLGMSS